MKRRSFGLLVAVFAVVGLIAVAASGCSDDSTDDDAAAGDSAEDTSAETGETIVELLSSNPDYSTLASLIVSAELSDTLSSAGPFVVFAPQNTAFAALSAEQTAALENDPNLLRQVLNYHVVAGELPIDDLTTENLLRCCSGIVRRNSVEGSQLMVVVTGNSGSGNSVEVNDAEVVDPGLLASNGVVHGIDAVLIPQVST
jgi:uncharacterized surface protein with fasciclin (FAS1) repeats